MKTISIDIETYSGADLAKCGVYRYAEAPDFEILLFGYSVDGGAVRVVDLTAGEAIPRDVLDALTDDGVTKWAFNANFERVCLSRHLSDLGVPLDPYADAHPLSTECARFLNPAGWRCTMVWAAYLGLPLSLAGVGAALGLDRQKMAEGKDIVKYFCQPCPPTKANGMRTRSLPGHAPDKWEIFKAYNRRDVETEAAIQRRLKNHPVPEEVWAQYHHDQEINDRGIALDMALVESAIQMDDQSRKELTAAMRERTDLENPGSVAQMKKWLSDNGLETETLGKKQVAALLKDCPPEMREVLLLRQQLAKSSVKKYIAMKNAVCADGRARGMFLFYGANRTGRFCLTGDHEVLTPDGWRRLDEWTGGSIACWNADSEAVSFQRAERVTFDYAGPMYTYHDARVEQCSTPDHKMWAQRRFGSPWGTMTVEQMALCRPCIPLTGYRYFRGRANQAWLRVLIMTQADGYYCEDGGIRFRFKKQRKVERCKMLLRRAEIAFSEHFFVKDSVFDITIPVRSVPLWLRQFRTKTFGYWLFEENPDVFFDELPYWDGYRAAPNSIQYSTINRQNADIVQALAHMSGRTAIMRRKNKTVSNPKWSDSYIVDIWLTPSNCHEIRSKPTVSEYTGKVFCAVTPTGYFLTRRNGKVWVTGNSGRLIQLQNLPQNHLPDLDAARRLVQAGDYDAVKLLFGDVPDTLSQLIRTAFVPREGCKFIVSDFSAIEARVIAWLAGEQWRQKVFEAGGDIYCASASAMFHVPVVKHGVNGHLRQKGKIAELALGYGGSVGALKAMGALEMGIPEEELQPLVSMWRSSNPNIVKLWWDVDAAVMEAVEDKSATATHGISFECTDGMLFLTLPSGRHLSYVKPRIGTNRFGGNAVTYMGTGGTKKWERIESYGPKFCENIVQAISRDILCYAMQTLRHCRIVAHVHDELILECDPAVSLDAICAQMGRTPPWAPGLILRADGYETPYYKKD